MKAEENTSKPDLRLRRKEFEEAIQPYFKQWGQCYDKALQADSTLVQGDIVLKLAIENGRVIDADTHMSKTSIPREAAQSLYTCVLDVAKRMEKLPIPRDRNGIRNPKARVQIRYPLEFSPNINVTSGINSSKGAALNAQDVQKAFELSRFEMGQCYVRSYRKKKQLPEGRMLVQIEVQQGSVVRTPTLVEMSSFDPKFTDCILEVIGKIKFPLPNTPNAKAADTEITTITYPLIFGKK